MTRDARELLTDFDALAPADQHAFAVEILRRVNDDYGPLTDDALNALSDELFQALDEEEGSDGDTTTR